MSSFGAPLYPILDPDACRTAGVDPRIIAGQWMERGLRRFQLRAKRANDREYLDLARELVRCYPAARLVANDRWQCVLAESETFRGGLHLGQEDSAELLASDTGRAALKALRQSAIPLGISTHGANQFERACQEAQHGKWDYVALGPLWETSSKPDGRDPALGPETACAILDAWVTKAPNAAARDFAIVLIGGINAARISILQGQFTPEIRTLGPIPSVISAGMNSGEVDAMLAILAQSVRIGRDKA